MKIMGPEPGDCTEEGMFSLTGHQEDNLTDQQSADRIAEHFADISCQFSPLDISQLPPRVKTILGSADSPPVIYEHEVFERIRQARKTRGSVPGDLPSELIKEFEPELTTPVTAIIANSISNAQWPSQWKIEYVTPLGKIPQPESEDDLRPISLTNFFSKIMEKFVFDWLLKFIGEKIDFRQYGGMKGNSTSHYIIELINFILMHQDSAVPTAVIACMVDFSKAFNRQDHSILITKLCDMNVPSWLLKLVIAFLSNRKMHVQYKGEISTEKPMKYSKVY